MIQSFLLSLIFLLFGLAGAQITGKTAHDAFIYIPLFHEFIAKFNKTYSSPSEYEYRYQVFVENMKTADALNEMEGAGVHGVTRFMDVTPTEFKRYLGFIPRRQSQSQSFNVEVPTDRDMCGSTNSTNCNYADLGAVTPVKDQGQCGSCWAFSATEAIETAWFLSGHAIPILSPQEIVDCDKTDGGCNGGDTPTAYEFVIKEGGLEPEASYPYTARDGTCKFNSSAVVAKISSYSWAIKPCNTAGNYQCTNQDENGLWTFVQNQGPVSICVDAEPWQTYTGGIFSGAGCKSGYYDLDHCVQLTGFGVDNGIKYWLVKNSWGTNWGEQGYIRLKFGANICGVADEVTVAVSA